MSGEGSSVHCQGWGHVDCQVKDHLLNVRPGIICWLSGEGSSVDC